MSIPVLSHILVASPTGCGVSSPRLQPSHSPRSVIGAAVSPIVGSKLGLMVGPQVGALDRA